MRGSQDTLQFLVFLGFNPALPGRGKRNGISISVIIPGTGQVQRFHSTHRFASEKNGLAP
jgi:hypothetical protein